jgi:phosphotransferase system enzyme I (PtsI)
VVVVDAARSVLVEDPAPELVDAAGADTGAEVVTGPGTTADGRPVALLANLGSAAEVPAAMAAGAEGVGLFRTEFLFLDAVAAPTAADQEVAYRAVFSAFAGSKVVIRVLDAGADKPLAFVDLGSEPNPALGVRGLRALRVHQDLLDTQLDAIAAAAKDSGADVWVMAPMVADSEDAAWFTARARSHGLTTAGAMIEIPAAAITAGSLLKAVSFASIGTNDLAQYTMAADRLAGALGSLQDPWHPAILRLIELVGAAGSVAGKPIGVCGEAAADPLLACVLVGLGATSLSMAPPALAGVRAALAQYTFADCVRFGQVAVAASTAAEARERVLSLA